MTYPRKLTKNAPVPALGPASSTTKFRAALSFELDTKALTDKPDGYVAGWASTPDIDHYRHIVEVGAFQESINERGLTGPRGIKLLINHDWGKPGGVIEVLEYRGDKLWIEAQLNLDITYVSDAYKAAKMAGGFSFSVGFERMSHQWDEINGIEVLRILRGDLYEVSMVIFPGNEAAEMLFIKDRSDDDPVPVTELYPTLSELEKSLVDGSLVKGRKAATRISKAFKARIAGFGQEIVDLGVVDHPDHAPLVLDALTRNIGLFGQKSADVPVTEDDPEPAVDPDDVQETEEEPDPADPSAGETEASETETLALCATLSDGIQKLRAALETKVKPNDQGDS